MTSNPVQPGQVIQFTVTVTNVATATQGAHFDYVVPQFTTTGGSPAGTTLSYPMGYLAAGATGVVSLDFHVLNGSQAPPDGSLITLVVSDGIYGTLASCSATVRSLPAAVLELSSSQSTVTPGGYFFYTLAYHNGGSSALSNAQLSLTVPVGASFVFTDGGGVLGADRVVRWPLSSVAAGATGEVNIILKAATSTDAQPPLVIQAALSDSASQILAQVSDAKAIYVTPVLSYALTTTANPVQPGQVIHFTVTVTNLSTVSQDVTLNYDIPQFTTGSYPNELGIGHMPAGTAVSYDMGLYKMGALAAGATAVVSLDFQVLSGSQAPPDGSLITALVSDRTNGVRVSCSAIVRSLPAAVLELSCPQSPLTSGGYFTYTLAYHNGGTSNLTNAQLSLPVPVGARFISADGGGVFSDGVVRWPLSSVATGASGEVNVNLRVATTVGTQPPIFVQAGWSNSAGQILAQANDAKAIYVAPPLSYALTTTANPVLPGQGIQFTVTVTNLSTFPQPVVFLYNVPKFTTVTAGSGTPPPIYPPGTVLRYDMGAVAAGATAVVSLHFDVLSGSQAPPDGSLITLVVSDATDQEMDQTRGVLVSSSAIVKSLPAAVLALSTPQSPVLPGGIFSYALAYHNAGTGALTSAQLSLPAPLGASFVSATGGGVLGSDGVVRWTLNSVAAGASGDVTINLKAPKGASAHPPLFVQAALRDSAGQILARASDAKAIQVAPALSYALTTAVNPVQPGQGVQFTVTVTNLSSVSQTVTLNYDVPQFTTDPRTGSPAGTTSSYNMGDVAAGATAVVSLDFEVLSGSQAPPDGSLITAVVSDRTNGGLVSCSAIVRSLPAAVLALFTPQSPVVPGGTFSYTLAYHNGGTSALTSAQLSLPVPADASFVSATGGGVLGSDGVVRWPLNSVAAGASGDVTINLKAPTGISAHPPLLLQAALLDSVGQVLAQASDAKAIDVTKVLFYALTTTANPALPGQAAQFTVKITNLSTVTQTIRFYYAVPQFTTGNGNPAGTPSSYNVGNLAAGATEDIHLTFTVLSGSQAPPNGSLITLVVTDRVHGYLVSRTVAVRISL